MIAPVLAAARQIEAPCWLYSGRVLVSGAVLLVQQADAAALA